MWALVSRLSRDGRKRGVKGGRWGTLLALQSLWGCCGPWIEAWSVNGQVKKEQLHV